MSWRDEALVLANQPQGENHSLLTVFAEREGRRSALVYGGQGRGKLPALQCGNGLDISWTGKSETSLGRFDLELTEPRAAAVFSDPKALAALSATAELLLHVLPEGEGLSGLYRATVVLFDSMSDKDIWPVVLAKWELGLLTSLGHGLTLDRCVATDTLLEDGAELCFVSPKSGGAVSFAAGMPYRDKLLPLPPFITGLGEPTRQDVAAALRMSGYFLEARLLEPIGRTLPEGRRRLPARFQG
jgi:DNA repair protein RecO (recombination protein O)